MNKTFADTFYYLALLNPGDSAHQHAVAVTSQQSGTTLVTTHWVLTEVGDAMSGPADRSRFARLIDALEADRGTIVVPATAELFREGVSLFKQRPDKSWSLTDCISFTVMNRHGITDALSGDHHFAQAGFKALMS